MPVDYAVLLPGDEDYWAAAGPEERKAVYGLHEEFMTLLVERGHEIIGGAELAHSREAKLVRGRRGSVTVTDGPYAESVEQLTGFYLVRTDDLTDLLDLCGVIAGDDVIQVRRVVPGPTDGAGQ